MLAYIKLNAMLEQTISIRNANENEFKDAGQLVAEVYSQLEGFPKPDDHPDYYSSLYNIGTFTTKPETELLVAVQNEKEILGAVVYFGEMEHYGSGGIATRQQHAAGIRLLAVHPEARGLGLGKLLTEVCIEKAKDKQLQEVILHSTSAMQTAWGRYERMGFKRSEDLDFLQGEMTVFGFRLEL